MLKETGTEETIGFVEIIFYHRWHFNWGGAGPLLPLPWLRLCSLSYELADTILKDNGT